MANRKGAVLTWLLLSLWLVVYSAFLFFAFLVLLVALPETKGKSLEQTERDLVGEGQTHADTI